MLSSKVKDKGSSPFPPAHRQKSSMKNNKYEN